MVRLLVSVVMLFLILFQTNTSAATSIKASQPTHYFYSPTAYVNAPFHFVGSFHEISYSLPPALQLQMSLFDNIGRVNLGARYGFKDNLSVGAGMAWSFVDFTWGGHGIPRDASPRLGLFLCYGFARRQSFEANITPNMQIGDHVSIGADFALMGTPSEYWSVIGEAGLSFDITDGEPYLGIDAGFRVHPPKIPFMNFDLGIDLVETPLSHYHPSVGAFFDVIFTMVTNR